MNKETFEDCYGPKFQKKLDKMTEEQHDMVMRHIRRICPGIQYTENDDYYIFNSDQITLEDLKKIWEYISQL